MKTDQALILKQFLLFYFIVCTNSWSLSKENDVEASGMDTDLIQITNKLEHVENLEQKILRYEQQLNSMTTTFNQLEENINSLINTNMKMLENNLQTKLEELVDQKISLNSKLKKSYEVQEIKCSNNKLPENCYQLNECNKNLYSIMIPNFQNDESFPAVCDLKTLDGGWTIIQRRQDGSENFFRNWTDYVEGFGNLNGEFFIGLEKLHALTTQGEPQELYIILKDFEGTRKYAQYNTFKVDSESTNYKLSVGDYSGDAGDSFSGHNGQMFSTRDRDNDKQGKNCGETRKGGWWYIGCFYSNLNGKYLFGRYKTKSNFAEGAAWNSFHDGFYSLKFIQMMIRPKQD